MGKTNMDEFGMGYVIESIPHIALTVIPNAARIRYTQFTVRCINLEPAPPHWT